MVKVHQVIARMNMGGCADHVAHLCSALGPGYQTTLVTGVPAKGERDMVHLARDAGVDVRVLPGFSREVRPGSDMAAVRTLYRLFRAEAPDIVHTHTAKAGALGRVAAVLAQVPVRIHTFHGHVLGGRYFAKRKTRAFLGVERFLASRTHRIVALTEGQKKELAEELGVAPIDRFRVIPLGLELARFRDQRYPANRAKARASLGLPETAFVVASVGRLVPIKRHDLLLRAASELSRTSSVDWRLVVVGGGDLEAELRDLADALGIASRVLWLGWRDDVPEVLGGADVLALSSDDEGTPVSVIEAIAAGLPVVSTDVGGVGELLSDVPGTWLTEPGSVDAFANALHEAATHRKAVPAEVCDRFVQHFSVERLAADMDALYRTELRRAGIGMDRLEVERGAGLRAV